VTRAIIGSFLSFSDGVWYSSVILSDKSVFENLRHFVSQNFILAVFCLDLIVE